MKFIGSKNSKPGSWLIRKVTGSKSSHFLMVFDEKLVVHSTMMSGLHLSWFSHWLKSNEIVWEISLPLSLAREEEVYESILNEGEGTNYDFLAFFYWPFAVAKHCLLGSPMPTRNPWGSNKGLLCVGVYARLPEWLVGKVDESTLEMTTPDKLGEIIKYRMTALEGEL